jgi:hypothetical protein
LKRFLTKVTASFLKGMDGGGFARMRCWSLCAFVGIYSGGDADHRE